MALLKLILLLQHLIFYSVEVVALPSQSWPSTITAVIKNSKTFTPQFSGIKYIAGATLADDRIWGADNDGVIWKLKWNTAGYWQSDTVWGTTGRKLNALYDSEGITFGNSTAFAYFSSERIGSGASELSVNEFSTANPTKAGATLTPTKRWILTSALPIASSSNDGLEAITFVPDQYLVNNGFTVSTGVLYNPTAYPRRVGGGVFFVGFETDGKVYAFILNSDQTSILLGGFFSGESSIVDLDFDPNNGYLWTSCDNRCAGRTHVFTITNGIFTEKANISPPAGPIAINNLNVEGFTVASEARCGVPSANRKYAYWSNDDTGDLYTAQIKCGTEANFLNLPAPVV